MKLNLADGAYEVGATPQILQECVNLFPEVIEQQGGRSVMCLRRVPGLTAFASIGSGPIRGQQEMDGVAYVVSGDSLYSYDANGSTSLLGAVAGTGRVGMAVNLASPKQMMIVGGNTGYIYDTSNGLQTISDPDFPSPTNDVQQLDGYFIVVEQGTARFWISNGLDGTNWNGLDFASKEAAPGDIVALIPNHRDLFLFGERTFEVWRNNQNVDFTFGRQEGTFQQRGCASAGSVANIDNTAYFLGDDLIVYRIDGYAPARISNHGVEHALSGYTQQQITDSTSFTYTDRGHIFYCLNVGGDTWAYDSTTSQLIGAAKWHKRRTGEAGRWRIENHLDIYGKHLGGDYSRGILWHMDNATFTDNSQEVHLTRTIGPLFYDAQSVSISKLKLSCSTGHNVASALIALEVSKDDGKTWGPKKYKSLGVTGQYSKPIVWRRLGRGSNFYFRFTVTDAVDMTINECYVDVEIGDG